MISDQAENHDSLSGDAPPLSPGEQAIERVKRSHLRLGQFRITTLIVAISFVAVVLGSVRWSGGNYPRFFVACFGGICVFLPFLAWFSVSLIGIRNRRRRYAIASAMSVLGFAALAIAAAVYPPMQEILVFVSVVALVFWPVLAIWAHLLDVEAFGNTKNRNPKSPWNRFTLAIAQLGEHGELAFRCIRCQRIRADAGRQWRKDGWLCHECYLFEIRHAEKLQIPGDTSKTPD